MKRAVLAFIVFSVTVLPNSMEASPTQWRVAADPLMAVGGDPEDSRYQLLGVRDAVRTSDGTVVVVAAGLSTIRLYGADGGFVREFGDEGGGPGEFRDMVSAHIVGDDSLFVFDRALQRVSLFRLDGELIDDWTFGAADGHVLVEDIIPLGNGQWVSVERKSRDSSRSNGLQRRIKGLILRDREFGVLEKRVSVPGEVWATETIEGNLGTRMALFTPQPRHDVFGSCFLMVPGDRPYVQLFGPGGSERILDLPLERAPVTEELIHDWIDAAYRDAPEEQLQVIKRILPQFPAMDSVPAIHQAVVGSEGFVWVQPFVMPLGPGRVWHVYDGQGDHLVTVEMPRELRVFQIDREWIVGLRLGEYDEEILEVYRVYKTDTPDRRTLREECLVRSRSEQNGGPTDFP